MGILEDKKLLDDALNMGRNEDYRIAGLFLPEELKALSSYGALVMMAYSGEDGFYLRSILPSLSTHKYGKICAKKTNIRGVPSEVSEPVSLEALWTNHESALLLTVTPTQVRYNLISVEGVTAVLEMLAVERELTPTPVKRRKKSSSLA